MHIGNYINRLQELARKAAEQRDWHSFDVFMAESNIYTSIWYPL